MWGWRSARTLLVGTAVAAFVLFCVLPLAYMVAVWLVEPGPKAAVFRALLLDSRQRGLLLNTAVLGVGTALTATIVGSLWVSRSRAWPCLSRPAHGSCSLLPLSSPRTSSVWRGYLLAKLPRCPAFWLRPSC